MLTRPEHRLVQRLKRRKARDEQGLFLAEGVRVVEDLLAARGALRLAVISTTLEDTARGRALAAALAAACPVRHVDDAELAALAATEAPQGVIVVAEAPRRDLAGIEVAGPAVVLVLDAVQDPGNFGALVRTADALGVAFVAALPGTVDPWNPKAVRAAAGSSFRMPVVQPGLDDLLEWLGRHGFALYGSDADGLPADSIEPAQRAALAVGNEGVGLDPRIRAAADAVLAVPIRRSTESLNVAVAAGILLYLLTRKP